ncbi:ABC transporter substrate-binding protein [Nitrincola sp.]|uniref:ABC transporter substrate-binding protein n=1 Tax=Nitrincola sp. TaxID=1926584 RepID=UPI003A93A227
MKSFVFRFVSVALICASQAAMAEMTVIAIDYNAQTLERHIQSTRVLGEILGQSERAESLVSLYKTKTQDTLDRVTAAGPTGKKIYVELAQKGPDEIGNSYGRGMWAGVINLVGGHNIAEGQIGNWGPLSAEYIISQQPDIVLLAGSEWVNQPHSVQMGFAASDERAQERLSSYAKRPGWESFPAVQNKAMYGIYHGGNRTLSDFVYVRAIAKALYPQAFTDVDPAQELLDYYNEWMPIDADGLFVTQLK